MTFEITYSKKAEKYITKLPKDIQERILCTLERCRIRPYAHIKKLVGSPFYSLRAGDYRIIMDIDNGKLIILVIEVGHRKNVYK
jgi:mRNA interferase RelE/StbE